ncbi:MAG: hypothetical protein ACLKAK_10725 [Alkaliphilus sp.]
MKVIEISSLTKYYGKSKGIENVNLEANEGCKCQPRNGSSD